MKKLLIPLLMLILCSALLLSACSGGGGGEESSTTPPPADESTPISDEDDIPSGIDPTSSEVQQVSANKASKDQLSETVNVWLEKATMFPEGSEIAKRTYKDFVDYIGCDATEYYFDTNRNARVYSWIAEEADSSKLSVWFVEKDGTWHASLSGAANLG